MSKRLTGVKLDKSLSLSGTPHVVELPLTTLTHTYLKLISDLQAAREEGRDQ